MIIIMLEWINSGGKIGKLQGTSGDKIVFLIVHKKRPSR
jgi:hypothetical protein